MSIPLAWRLEPVMVCSESSGKDGIKSEDRRAHNHL
jgi:hypothetical protein